MGDITTSDAFLWHNARGDAMIVPPDSPRVNGDVPCLVVTGDLDPARELLAIDLAIVRGFEELLLHLDVHPRPLRMVLSALSRMNRLRPAAPDDAAIERAARKAWETFWSDEDGNPAAGWDGVPSSEHDHWRSVVRIALAAAEETPDA